MNLYILLAGIVIYSVLSGCLFQKMNIITRMVIGCSLWFCVYVILSGLLFWADIFTLPVAIAGSLLTGLVVDGIYIVRGRRGMIIWPGNDYVIPAIILALALPLCIDQFEIYGMGQDEGVYQAKALAILSGEYSNQVDIEEYHILPEGEKQEYLKFLDNFTGYYHTAGYIGFTPDKQHCEASGYYHGIPNMAALLALSAVMFGIEGMKGINLLIYIATLWLIYEISKLCFKSKMTRTICTLTVAISPIVIWVTKSSVTENLLTLSIVLFLFMILYTGRDGRNTQWIIVPITAFCFFHISAFMLMPLFNVILLLKYTEKKNKEYVYINLCSLVSFALGYWMMLSVSPEYAHKNLGRVLAMGFTDRTLWLLPVVYGALIAIITLIIVKLCSENKLTDEKLYNSSIVGWIVRIIMLAAIVNIIRLVWNIHLMDPNDMTGNNFLRIGYMGSDNLFNICQYTSFYAVCLMGGVILLPILMIALWVKPSNFINRGYMAIAIPFFYLVFVCDAFVLTEVSYYYYYARYLVYTVVIGTLAGGMILERILNREGRVFDRLSGPILGMVAAITGIAVLLPFSIYLGYHEDDSCMQTADLMDISDSMVRGAAVIVSLDYDTTSVIWNLRALSDAALFPVFEDYEGEIDLLKEHYDKVYILSDNDLGNNLGEEYVTVYTDSYIHKEYANRSGFMWIPLISDTEEEVRNIYLFSTDEADAATDYTDRMQGLTEHIIAPGGVMYGPYIDLMPGEYTLYVNLMDMDKAGTDESDVDGVYVGETEDNSNNENGDILPVELMINAEAGSVKLATRELTNGMNKIEFTLDKKASEVEFVVFNTTDGNIRVDLVAVSGRGGK